MSKHGGKREGAGRPPSDATLKTQLARQFIAEQLALNLGPIVEKAIEQAKEGNQQARDWLSDQAWGKIPQSIDHTTLGKELPQPILHVLSDDSDKEDIQAQEEN